MTARPKLSLFFLLLLSACSTQQTEIESAIPSLPDPDRVFSYVDGTSQYVQTTVRRIDQEISGQTTSSQTLLRFQVTSNIENADGNRNVRFVIDSVMDAEGPGYTPSARRDVTGLTLRGAFSETGRIGAFDIRIEPSPLLTRLTTLLGSFFPLIPPGGPIPGMQWVDTTQTTTNDGSTRLVTTGIISSSAGSWERDGSGLPITWRMEYSFTGEGQQLGQSFTLEGTGRRNGEHVLSADGVYLQGASIDSSEASVLLPAIGITVPVIQTGVDSVRIIR